VDAETTIKTISSVADAENTPSDIYNYSFSVVSHCMSRGAIYKGRRLFFHVKARGQNNYQGWKIDRKSFVYRNVVIEKV